jgi:hypothetical protein
MTCAPTGLPASQTQSGLRSARCASSVMAWTNSSTSQGGPTGRRPGGGMAGSADSCGAVYAENMTGDARSGHL